MHEAIIHKERMDSCEYPLGLCAAGYHVVVLLDAQAAPAAFGRCRYDFQEGTLLFPAPGRSELFAAAARCPAERMVAFDPAQFRCTGLDRAMDDYAFFDYLPSEMLHVAACERRIVVACMQDIARESACREDFCSCRLLSQQLRLLLDHCTRMYERQFVTREPFHRPLLARYEAFVTRWIESGRMQSEGAPSAALCAAQAGLSEAYLGSLLQFETGYTHAAFVEQRRLETAKRLLGAADRPVGEIAAQLGFASEACFCRYFRKITGLPPRQYRRPN